MTPHDTGIMHHDVKDVKKWHQKHQKVNCPYVPIWWHHDLKERYMTWIHDLLTLKRCSNDAKWRQMTPNTTKSQFLNASNWISFVALFSEARPHTMSSMIYYDTKSCHDINDAMERLCDTKWQYLNDVLCPQTPLKIIFPVLSRRLILDIWVPI